MSSGTRRRQEGERQEGKRQDRRVGCRAGQDVGRDRKKGGRMEEMEARQDRRKQIVETGQEERKKGGMLTGEKQGQE